MSWLFSQALVEEYSGASSSGGEPSAPSNGNPIPQAFCAPDKTTVFSRLSRFGMTFKPLTEDRGEALLMSYLAAFPARTSPQQEPGPESTESAAECGNTWRGWLAKYDPDTSSWRTAQCSLLEDSTECLQTFPRSGMTRGGLLWELPMLERRTKETGSGLLEKLPTPQASDYITKRTSSSWKAKGGVNFCLSNPDIQAKWPTPAARDYKGANGFETTQRKIGEGKRAQMGQLPNAVQQELGRPIGGTLNPNWTEWLMGWPLGWTDLKPLEMDKSHCVPQQPGEC